MADVGLTVGGAGSGATAPLAYNVPGAGEVILKAAFARLDGTAAGSFVPCLRVKTPNGQIMLECVGSTVAAGGAADVTWFPGLASQAGTLETTDTVTTVNPTDELLIGAGLTLANPGTGIAELSASFSSIIHGRVSAGTTPTFTGTGFTGIRTGTGTYTISFSPPLSQAPAIAISAYGNASNAANAASAVQNGAPSSGTGFTVTTWNPAVSVAEDCGFDFIAIPTGGSSSGPHFPVQSNIVHDDSAYNAFPWVCYMADNTTQIGIYRSGASHTSVDGKITIRTSTDGGNTWGAATAIFTPGAGHDYRDPSICLTNTGRLLVNFFDYDGTNVLGIYTTHSDDNGATWSALPAILTPYTSTVDKGATSGAVIQTSGGTLIMPVYGRDGVESADQFGVLRSSDNGATWGSLIRVSAAATNYNEATFIQLASGTVRAYVRKDGGSGPMYTTDSTDSGATWSALSALGWNTTPGRPAAVRTLTSGTIFLMYRQLTTSYPAYRYSTDNGVTWSAETAYSVTGLYEYAGGFARPGTDQLAMAVATQNASISTISYVLNFTWVVS